MSERARDRDRTGPTCATCMAALDAGPPAICSTLPRGPPRALRARRTALHLRGVAVRSTSRSTNAEDVPLDAVVITFIKRDLWKWLLPSPFWVVSAWVLQTSERVWRETVLVSSSRGGRELVTVGALSRRRLIMGLLFFAIAPAFVAWILRLRQTTTSASGDEPPPTWHRVIEWTVRLGALWWIASVTHFVWSYR